MALKIGSTSSKVGVQARRNSLTASTDNTQQEETRVSTTRTVAGTPSGSSASLGAAQDASARTRTAGSASASVGATRSSTVASSIAAASSGLQSAVSDAALGAASSRSIRKIGDATGSAGLSVSSQDTEQIVAKAAASRTMSMSSVTREPADPGRTQRTGGSGTSPGSLTRQQETANATARLQSIPAAYSSVPYDFVHAYGLYTLQPEILGLYDFDPVFLRESSGSSREAQFLAMQRAASKVTQDAAYRTMRGLLSQRAAQADLPFETSYAKGLSPASQFEADGNSFFEQLVARWDKDHDLAAQFTSQAQAKSTVAQNIASLLDISNLPDSKGAVGVGFGDILAELESERSTRPIATPIQIVQDGVTNTIPRHAYVSFSGRSAVSSLVDLLGSVEFGASLSAYAVSGYTPRIDAYLNSYTLMYWLLQNAAVGIVAGSPRKGNLLTSSVAGSSPTSVRRFKNDQYASRLYTKRVFTRPEEFVDNVIAFRASSGDLPGLSSSQSATAILRYLSVLSAFRASSLYSPTSGSIADVLTSELGVRIFQNSAAPSHSLTAIGRAPTTSVLSSLFNFPAALQGQSGTAIFFDRYGNAGLLDGFIHGYPLLFGSGGNAATVAQDLINAINTSVSKIDRVEQGIFYTTIDIEGGWGSRTAADFPYVVMTELKELLALTDADDEVSGDDVLDVRNTYGQYAETAGTGSSQALGLSLPSNAVFPVVGVVEIAKFLALSIESGSLAPRAKRIVNTLMTCWSQTFDYKTGARERSPDAITVDVYGDTPSERIATFGDLESFYGIARYEFGGEDIVRLSPIFKLVDDGNRIIERIVDWVIRIAGILFPASPAAVTRVTTTGPGAVAASISSGESSDNAASNRAVASLDDVGYNLKEICLLLTAFVGYSFDAIFSRSSTRRLSSGSPTDFGGEVSTVRSVIMQFNSELDPETTISQLISSSATDLEDARCSLRIVRSQLTRIAAGLQYFTTENQSASFLRNSNFDFINTPVQSFSSSIRRADFLSRPALDPFLPRKYDQASSLTLYKRDAAAVMLEKPLFKRSDVKVLFVGLPCGITHIIGPEETYVKLEITRRNKDTGEYGRGGTPPTEDKKVVKYFDAFLFCSPEKVLAEDRSASFTPMQPDRSRGTINTTLFRVNEEPTLFSTSLPTLSESISLETTGTVDVDITDYTVKCTFLSREGLFKDLGVSSSSNALDAVKENTVVDYLLKSHIREMSGLDFDEAVFTTSSTAFNPRVPDNMDELAARAYSELSTTLITSERALNPENLASDVRKLELVSRSPAIRSNVYRDLCERTNIFDRVFAVPISLGQF